jgi:alpha-beta hydrolase superfamily lysophospholipase
MQKTVDTTGTATTDRSWSIPCDPAPVATPTIPDVVSAERRAELDAHLRAMPASRLLSNGMEYADAQTLFQMVSAGVDWIEAGTWLGERNLRVAHKSLENGYRVTARTYFRSASACFRVAQTAIVPDTEPKKHLYRRLVDAFADAAALDDRPVEHWTTSYGSGQLCGWLMRPSAPKPAPVVIVFGGFDGWREEHHASAVTLVDRGLSVLLVDAPGQGETRLFHNLFLAGDVHRAFSRMIEALNGDARVGGRFGIWGNSFGGCLAARAAIADKRFIACCVNGGASRPLEFPEKYPRFFSKVEAMVGGSGVVHAAAVLESIDLAPWLHKLDCPLLQLHSEADPVFSLENARQIHDRAASADKTLLVWKDGDHCIYNHANERNCAVADWFCERLGAVG